MEIPPIRPVVTQVERYGCSCPGCGEVQLAAVPVGLEPGSPFGDGVAALVTTLRYAHAISYARLSQLMSEVFNLSISEGALANLFERVKTQLDPTVAAIVQRLRSSRIVGSDETSARLMGKTVWEWVFQNADVCLHVIRPSRGAAVIDAVMEGHRPEIWVSDLYSAQKKHPAEDWQVCLAHQLRGLSIWDRCRRHSLFASDEANRLTRLCLASTLGAVVGFNAISVPMSDLPRLRPKPWHYPPLKPMASDSKNATEI